MDTELLFWTAFTGVASALATGLGAPVVFAIKEGSQKARAFASALAAGMMISASVFSLAQEGMEMQVGYADLKVIGGMLLGALFLWAIVERLDLGDDHDDDDEQPMGLRLSSGSIFVFIALFIHSAPEGVAIGVGFATGEFEFGLVMAIAISIHNIPEGIAMSLPMRASGDSLLKCAGYSVLTSLPQPLLAVPAAYLFHYLNPWLPLGLGFACGAMVYVVVFELIPESLEHGSETLTAWGVMIGLAGMLTITSLLPGAV